MQNRHLTIVTIILLLIVATFIASYSSGSEWSYEAIREGIASFGIWAPAAFIVLYTIIAIFLPVSPFIVMAGLLFGSTWGTFYALLGGVLGATVSFAVARKLGKPFVDRVLKKDRFDLLDKYNRHLENNGLYAVLILRLIPLIPLNGLSLALGVTRVSLTDYAIGTFFGIVPSTIILSYFGSGLFTWSAGKVATASIVVILLLIAPTLWHQHRKLSDTSSVDLESDSHLPKRIN